MQYYKTEDGFDLEEALEMLRDMKAEVAPALESIKALEARIKEKALEELEPGDAVEVEGARLSIRNGYSRTYWNGKALEGYAVANPEILEFRSERQYSPSAVIKVEV